MSQRITQADVRRAGGKVQDGRVVMPASKQTQIARNVAKAKRSEQSARNSNNAKLAAMPKAQPAPQVLIKGSGALVGVAAGAMDGQPHTKQAVADARKRLAAEARGEKDAVLAKLAKEEADTPLQVMGVAFTTAKAAQAKRKAIRATLETVAAAKASAPTVRPAKVAAPKAAKVAKAPKVAVDRAYAKGATAWAGKAGTWTEYMVLTTLKAKTTDAAKALHAKSGQYAGKVLDFKWMDAKGYIKLA